MSFPHLMIQMIRELEEDIVITNPRRSGRTLLKKIIYRCSYWLDRGFRKFKSKQHRRRP